MLNPRPFLKGKIHAVAAIIYAIYFLMIMPYVPSDLIIPVSIYLTCAVGHFLASALLHIPRWSDQFLPIIRKIDHIMIFAKIVSTYWVYICTVIPEANIYMRTCLFGGALLGILSRIFYTDASNTIRAFPYLMVGWSILFDLDCLYKLILLDLNLFIWSILGGLSYTIGAIVYMRQHPNPFPKILGFHEIFHIWVVIGAMCITYALFYHAIF